MLCLTIGNPYPELILLLEKPVENRTWPAPVGYIGHQLLIHAGASRSWMTDDYQRRFPSLPYGAIVGVSTLKASLPKPDPAAGSTLFSGALTHWRDAGALDLLEHPHAIGPYCFLLTDVKRFRQPVPCRGFQRFWRINALKSDADRVRGAVLEQLQEVA